MVLSPTEAATLRLVVAAAQGAMRATGLPASVQIAQCWLESGLLKHMPPGSNNCFGIKAEHLNAPDTYIKALTTEYVNGDLQRIEQPFEKYGELADCFTDHARLLTCAPRYAPLAHFFRAPFCLCWGLQCCGYSTSPRYGNELIDLVNTYSLTAYDLLPSAGGA